VCTQVCPSKALAVLCRDVENRDVESREAGNREVSMGEAPTGSPVDVIRFELDLDRCIGCRRCVEDCPEDALMMRPAPILARASRVARASSLDLLEKGDIAR
jgi:formate hydrogenlyase subunit 6/NADH:ubiquinone oxidoreductase subunit I